MPRLTLLGRELPGEVEGVLENFILLLSVEWCGAWAWRVPPELSEGVLDGVGRLRGPPGTRWDEAEARRRPVVVAPHVMRKPGDVGSVGAPPVRARG